MKKLNVMFQSKPNFSDNAKSLYDFMKNKYKDKMNFYWVIDNLKDFNRLKHKINCVLNDSEELYNLFSEIDIIFTTHGQLKERKLENQIYVNLWHGVGPKKIGYLLPNEKMAKNDDVWYEELREKTDYIIVPNNFWQLIFSAIFKTNYNRILPIGYPKLNTIVNSDGIKNLSKILGFPVDVYKKVIFYTPTFKNGCNRKDANVNTNNIFDLNPYDEKKLINFLRENNYLLCVKRHFSEENIFPEPLCENIFSIKDDKLLNEGFTINDILNAADLLITDYSSLGIEFSILKKPIIYLNNDIEDYMEKRGLIFDDASFWFGNLKNKNITDLIIEINEKIKLKKIESDSEKWFGKIKNGGCESICNFFFNEGGSLNESVSTYNDELLKKYKIIKKENQKIKADLTKLNDSLQSMNQELYTVYNSKGWKLLEKLRKLKR